MAASGPTLLLAPPLAAWGGLAGVVGLLLALWLVQRRQQNAGWADVGWAASVGLLALLHAAAGSATAPRRATVALMGGLWAGRLVFHLLRDRLLGHEEEGRYARLRARWAPRADARFLPFFLAQALGAWLLALPFLLAAGRPEPWPTPLDVVAPALFLLALGLEVLADHQLARFKADPAHRGQVCDVGLWGWSRHPNYFFEWTIWVAFALLALPAEGGLLALLAPAAILFLLLFVTGIPPTEAQALRSRGEAYRRYQERVSAFVPLPPRSGA